MTPQEYFHKPWHKQKRVGGFKRIDNYYVAWEAWTDCEQCGEIKLRRGIELNPIDHTTTDKGDINE